MIYTKETGTQNASAGAIEMLLDTSAAQIASWHPLSAQSSNVGLLYAGMSISYAATLNGYTS